MLRPLLRRAVLLILVIVALAVQAGSPGAAARPAAQGQPANAGRALFLPLLRNETAAPPAVIADLTIRPVPLREVQRGTTLSVEYRFRNEDTRAVTASFSLFYQNRLLSFVRLDSANDRYLGHDATRANVEVRNVAPGETRTGRIKFLVLGNASVGSRIALFAEFACRVGQTCQSNFAEVEVVRNSGDEITGGVLAMTVSPDRGPRGTSHVFSGSGFRPGESFVTWLNTPTGVQPLLIAGVADDGGRIRFTFNSGLIVTAGFYSIVAHGQRSGVQNVGPFIVQSNGQPGAVAAAPFRASAPVIAAPDVAPAPAQAAGAGGLAGRVIDGAGGGLAGVVVEVRTPNGELLAVTATRSDGRYVVPTGLATGQYVVTASPFVNPALALFATVSLSGVSVTSPELTADVNLTLPPAGALTGTVRAEGTGIAGVSVSAVAAGVVAAVDLTDATGTYTVTNLPAGVYTLVFDPQGAARAGRYDSLERPGQTVVVGQTVSVPAVDLAASPDSGVIAGRVTGQGAEGGVGDVLVVITRADAAESETFVSVARTAPDGAYVSDPLEPGAYRVQFVTLFSADPATASFNGEFFNDAPTFAESDPVNVTAGGQATANAVLATGGSIGGTVTGAGAGSLAEVLVAAVDGSGVPRAIDLTDAAGAYSLNGLPAGTYTVRALPSLSLNSAARAFADGGYDTTPATPELSPVELGAGATLTGIDIALAAGVQIGGVVSAGDTGAPLSQVIAVFIRDPRTNPALAGVALTDGDGRYTSPALAPGTYTIWFTTIFSADPTSRTYQDEFFNNRPSLAEADLIALGRTALTRNVELVPGGIVSGRVSGAGDEGLAGVFVIARVGTTPVGGTLTDETGRYVLEGLPPGPVTISYEPDRSPDPDVRTYSGTSVNQDVTVGAETIRDVVLALD